jgi:YgiT-type zinc finger domain-containing protein
MKTKSNNSCPLCGGKKEEGAVTYSVDTGKSMIVIRKVPALVCSQCGEEWINNETAIALEKIVANASSKKHQFEVLSY